MDPVAILAIRRSEPDTRHERPHFWPLIVLMLILLAVAVITLNQPTIVEPTPSPTASDTVPREARVYLVSYQFGVFSPTNLRIHAGDTVRWRNDSPLAIHVIAQTQGTGTMPAFDSIGPVQPDAYFAYTFSTAGVYTYFNGSDTKESGVIIVR